MNPYLLNVLPDTPKVVRDIWHQIAPGQVDVPTHPGRFTPRQVVAHLADWEPILLWRIQQAVQESGSEIPGIDEGIMAVENGYDHQDPMVNLDRWQMARMETVAYLRSIETSHWDRYVVHSERGKMTVYDQANLFLGHDLYHIAQITSVLAS